MMKSGLLSLSLLSSLLLLSGCEGQNARDILGLGRKAPDEFRVVSRPPLSTPPEFTLRPPAQGNAPALPPADAQARALVTQERDISDIDYDYRRQMGEAETAVGVVNSYEIGSDAETALLTRAGVGEANPSIRALLGEDRRATQESLENRWLIPQKDVDSIIVDATAEKARIEAAKEQNQPITTGETPVIEPKERGILEGIF